MFFDFVALNVDLYQVYIRKCFFLYLNLDIYMNRFFGMISFSFFATFALVGCYQKTSDPISRDSAIASGHGHGEAVTSVYPRTSEETVSLLQSQKLSVTDLAFTDMVRDALIESDFAVAEKALEGSADSRLSLALKILLDVQRSQEKLSAGGGYSSDKAMTAYLTETKSLSARFEEVATIRPTSASHEFHANYFIAVAALNHFSCIDEFHCLASGYFSDVPKKLKDKVLEENLFAIKIAADSIALCLTANPESADALLLQAVFKVKARDELGLTVLSKAIDRKPTDFFALLFAVKNWNQPLIVRNIDCPKSFMAVFSQNPENSIKLLSLARKKHATEYEAIFDSYRVTVTTGFPSQLLLDISNDSKLAMFNCDVLIQYLNQKLESPSN